MLSELVVEDLGVIERAELSLGPESSALTGETGAGKTLLVAAVGLLLGGRADRTMVRGGSKEARVEGRFVLPREHPACERLRASGVLDDEVADPEVEIVIGRVITADGRSGKGRINGRLVPVGLLGGIGPHLVEIAGQHQHQRISAPAFQRSLLDHRAGQEAVELAGTLRETVRSQAEAERRIEELRETERSRHRELDVLRFEIAEIEGASIVPGEAARLTEEVARLENSERLTAGLKKAASLLRDEGRAEDLIEEAEREIRPLTEVDPALGPLVTRLEAARHEAVDIAGELTGRIVGSDPGLLDESRTRLDAIAKLLRKYGDDEAEVLGYLERTRSRAEELNGAESDLQRWEEELERLTEQADEVAARLSERRRKALPGFEAEVMDRLAELALAGAEFRVHLEPRPLFEGGIEDVEFRISTNQGEPPLPISKVASGGELSRLALALHLGQRAGGDVRTMIFDEVDAGVGGGAAQTIGRALSELARSRAVQVLVVTHLPQVAAFSDDHLRVEKTEVDGRTRADVVHLDRSERVEELSRMMAGLPESEMAQEHARELLALAEGAPVA
ncbi:MAG: DNA repair protein RecN [Actinomycetota bacterium]